jgi:hypothetical protein
MTNKELLELYKKIKTYSDLNAFKNSLNDINVDDLNKNKPCVPNAILSNIMQAMLDRKNISLDELRLQLSAFDLLFCIGATTKSSEIKETIDAFNKRVARLFERMEKNPIDPFTGFSDADRNCYIVSFWIKMSFDILQVIRGLNEELSSLKFSGIVAHAPIIIGESHNERGAKVFLEEMKSKLLEKEYSLCFEYNYDQTKELLSEQVKIYKDAKDHPEDPELVAIIGEKLEFVANYPGNVIFIDPVASNFDPFYNKISYIITKLMRGEISYYLRDYGMYLASIISIIKNDGKVVVFEGGKHADTLYTKIRDEYKVQSLGVAACLDPSNFFIGKPIDDNVFYNPQVLVENLNFQLLDLSKDPKEQIEKFIENNFSKVNSPSTAMKKLTVS